MKILVADKIGKSGIAYLEEQGFTVDSQFEITAEELLAAIPEYDALVVRSRTKVPQDVITAGENLKVIGRAGVGVDNIDVGYAHEKEIAVVNSPGSNAESVAEHTIGLMLMLARNLLPVSSALANGRWEKKGHKAIELSGKTLGVIGFGRIGMRVAELGRSFGMEIRVYNRTQSGIKKELLERLHGEFVSLEELLKQSDIVTLHLAKVKETQALIGKEELSLMKKSAYLINCARGGIVDEDALIDALKDKNIAGAALDVFTKEPLDHNSPLCTLDNVLLTPHIGAVSTEASERAAIMIAEDIARVLKGDQAENAV